MNDSILAASLSKFLRAKIKQFLLFSAILVLLGILFNRSEILGKGINLSGVKYFTEFLASFVNPNIEKTFLLLVLKAAFFTVGLSIFSVSFSILMGFIFGLLSSKIFWVSLVGNQKTPIYAVWRLALSIFRSIPDLLWGLFMVNVFGLSPLSAICAIVIPYSSVTGKVFGDLIDSHNLKNYHAITNSGVHPIKAMFYSLIPDVAHEFLVYSFYRLDSGLRSSVVLGLIGLGGIGYQIMLSFQSLKFDEIWTLIYAVCILSYSFEYISARLRNSQEKKTGIVFNITACVFVIVSIVIFFWDWRWPIGHQGLAAPSSQALIEPILNIIKMMYLANWKTVFTSSAQTISMALMALMVSVFVGFIFAFMINVVLRSAAFSSVKKTTKLYYVISIILRIVLSIIRSIPPPIWALLILYLVYPSILTGALALGIYNIGILGKLMSESLENINFRQAKAVQQYGGGYLVTFFYGVFPQVLPKFTFYSLYRFEIILRDTILVSYIGSPGLGRDIIDRLTMFDYSGMVPSLFAFITLGFLVDLTSSIYKKEHLSL